REYIAGDELRRLDWKVFARSDRLVVKEMFEETTLACHLLVDASESMAFGSLEWSKFDYARWCAAALAHLVIGERDTSGLVLFDAKERVKVPPSSGERQKHAIWSALEAAQPSGPTGVGGVLQWLAGRLRKRGIVAIHSDFFDDIPSVIEGLRRLRHDGHEPILFQVLDPLELSFDIARLVRLDGLEGAGVLKVDPKTLRQAYVKELTAHNRELARHAATMGIDYVQLDTSRTLEAALTTYLAHRKARARGGRR
ncbi:MAG: DUF58 domain-containing protein, partial [Planctomycetes bacterium]|nr:DUF58 domain-containing protein [Planctomycetota bacterium]